MTQNLKIEVLTGDISIDGMVVTNLVTKEELSTAIVKKADLGTDGKIPTSQLPAEIVNTAGIVDEVKLQLETSIKDAVDESNAYAESYTDNAVSSKADLVTGKVPLEQLPAIDQYPQFGTSLSNLSTAIMKDVRARTDELEKTKADLGEDGKVLREQIPSYEKISGLPEQLEVMTTQTAAVSGELDQHKLQTADQIDTLKENIEANVQQLTDRQSHLMRNYATKELGVDAKVGVKPGEYFYVRSANEEEVLVEYQNVTGSAVATGKRYLSALGVQLQDKAASTIKDESGKDQQEINNIIYKSLNLVENWGAVGDGVTQDRTFVQAAIDDLHSAWVSTGKEQTLLFSSGKTYVLDGVTLKAGVHYATYGEGKARLLKTPAAAGQTDADLKWRRMLSTSGNMSTLGNTIRHKLSNIIIDGNMDNMNWGGSYGQEQGMSLILSCSNGTAESDRGKFELDNVEVVNSVSDGVCVNTNVDVVVNNCKGSRDFRGGVTIVGGNTSVIINNWIGESANIHIEVDGRGFNSTLKTDVTVNGGEVDRLRGKAANWGGYTAHVQGGSSVIYNNFKCHSGGLAILGGDAHPDNKILFNNCFLSWAGGLSYNIPKLLAFNHCTFLSDYRGHEGVRNGWSPAWNNRYTAVSAGAEIVFNGGRAIGLYDSDAVRGTFININTGGMTSDPINNPYRFIRFCGGIVVDGYKTPMQTVYGGATVDYDDIVVNTTNFLNLYPNNAIGAEGGIYIKLGKVVLGDKNQHFYNSGGNSDTTIEFNGTTIPASKFVISDGGNYPTRWKVIGQLTLTASKQEDINISNFKAFVGSRIIFSRAVRGGVIEYTAYPDATEQSLDRLKLTNNWSARLAGNHIVSAQKTYDPPSIAAGGSVTTTVTLTGAVVGDNVSAAFSQYNAGVRIYPVVSAANTVTVEFENVTSTPIDLASGTLTVKLI